VKVWLSFARFEIESADSYSNSKAILNESNEYFKNNEPDLKEERLMVLENLLKIEEAYGTEESI
jgi:hypothetical protein